MWIKKRKYRHNLPAWVLLHKEDRSMFTKQCSRQDGNLVSTRLFLSPAAFALADSMAAAGDMELVSSVDTTCATTSFAPQLIGVVTGT